MKALAGLLLGVVLTLPTGVAAQALPWESYRLVGAAELNFLFWPIYEASLYSPTQRFDFPPETPFALSLTYKRAFTGKQLVEETQRQWQDIGVQADPDWIRRLMDLLPDVNRDDTITLFVADEASHFFHNNMKLAAIADEGFSRNFAAIWLSERTSRPQFRDQLLGID